MSQARRSVLKGSLGVAAALVAGVSPLCSAAGHAAVPKRGGVLRVSTSLRINTLNPIRQLQTPEYLAAEALYSSLTTLSTKMEPEPSLALGWEANGDATEFTFRMRKGVTFHHGPAVTAIDAAATIKAILDPRFASPAVKSLGPIKDAVAIDDSTLRISLTGPFADLPVSLAHSNARIVPAAILAQDPKLLDNGDYGSGPFRLKSFDSQRGLRVERFADYWDAGHPMLDAIEVAVYPDTNTEAAALINGETDLLLIGQAESWDQLSAAKGVVPIRTQAGGFLNMILRMDQPPFNDIRVRRALALTLDRDALVQLVLEGNGRPAYEDPISPEYQYHSAPKPLQADITEARRLLAEAGYPNGLKLTLSCPNRPTTRTALGVAVREMARPAGFEIDVQTISYDVFAASVWRKNNFYVGLLNMQATEDAMFSLAMTSDAPWNETQWNNKEFDAVVAKARATVDPAERRALYAQAQALVTRDIPYIIPFYQDLLAARRSYVEGVVIHPRGNRFYVDRISLGEGAPKRA
jgi:peptide/nickel transport system substrate-binding protein